MTQVEQVRAALTQALGDDRLAGVDPEAQLLETGLVSSIELVSLYAALEEAFDLTIPPALANQAHLGTLAQLAAFVAGEAPGPRAEAADPSWLATSFRRFARRPLRGLALTLVALIACDLALAVWVESAAGRADVDRFTERGARLYPHGLGSLAHDDFDQALDLHEVRRGTPGSHDVLVFGDSGTAGSYLPADQAYASRVEAALQAEGLPAQVYNLAFYGRVFAKDLMLLEAVWDRPARVVVFCLSEDHFARSMRRAWIEQYPHVSYNHALFRRFGARLPADSPARAAFERTAQALEAADRTHWGGLRRLAHRTTTLPRQRGYVTALLHDRLLPGFVTTETRRWMKNRDARFAQGRGPFRAREGMPERELDADALALLDAAVGALRKRGTEVVLLLLPAGLPSWRRPLPPRWVRSAPHLVALAKRHGARLADARWVVGSDGFLDNLLHLSPVGNAAVAKVLTPAVRAALEAKQ